MRLYKLWSDRAAHMNGQCINLGHCGKTDSPNRMIVSAISMGQIFSITQRTCTQMVIVVRFPSGSENEFVLEKSIQAVPAAIFFA